MPEPRRHVENPITEVGFGGGTDAGHGSAASRARIFLGRHMRGMNQAPARIDGRMLEQPLHGALATPGQAVVHLLGLLGDMDVHRRLGQHGVQACERGLEAVRRHGAQRMRSQAQGCLLRPGHGLQLLQQGEHVVRAANDAGLILARRQAPEAAGLIEHGQQGHAYAGLLRRTQQRQRQAGIVGIGLAAHIMVHIVELAHRGVARLQHFQVQPGRDRLQGLGRHAIGKAVHQLAPAPEAVLRLTAEFGQPAERALEGVRVQIGHAGDQRAGRLGGFLRLSGLAALRVQTGQHFGQLAALVPAQQDVARPACGQQGVCGKQGTRNG